MLVFKTLFILFSLTYNFNYIECCAAKTCPSGWVLSSGKCFKLFESSVPHDEIDCQAGSFAMESENEVANLPSKIKNIGTVWVK